MLLSLVADSVRLKSADLRTNSLRDQKVASQYDTDI